MRRGIASLTIFMVAAIFVAAAAAGLSSTPASAHAGHHHVPATHAPDGASRVSVRAISNAVQHAGLPAMVTWATDVAASSSASVLVAAKPCDSGCCPGHMSHHKCQGSFCCSSACQSGAVIIGFAAGLCTPKVVIDEAWPIKASQAMDVVIRLDRPPKT